MNARLILGIFGKFGAMNSVMEEPPGALCKSANEETPGEESLKRRPSSIFVRNNK